MRLRRDVVASLPFYAVTLTRPWDWAMLHGKDVENRTLRFPAPKVGTWLALHAGREYDEVQAARIQELVLAQHAFGKWPGPLVVPMDDDQRSAGTVSAIVGAVRVVAVTKCQAYRESAWYFGQLGIWLADATAIQPVPCSGMQGKWPLPPGVRELVHERLMEARVPRARKIDSAG